MIHERRRKLYSHWYDEGRDEDWIEEHRIQKCIRKGIEYRPPETDYHKQMRLLEELREKLLEIPEDHLTDELQEQMTKDLYKKYDLPYEPPSNITFEDIQNPEIYDQKIKAWQNEWDKNKREWIREKQMKREEKNERKHLEKIEKEKKQQEELEKLRNARPDNFYSLSSAEQRKFYKEYFQKESESKWLEKTCETLIIPNKKEQEQTYQEFVEKQWINDEPRLPFPSPKPPLELRKPFSSLDNVESTVSKLQTIGLAKRIKDHRNKF
jgi:hypothetical protein